MMFCMDLQLQFFGTPVLRQRADEVERPTPELHALAEQMLEVMYAERGVGLAAEQVGRTERLFVIDIPPSSDIDERGERENPEVSMPLVCINPVIKSHSEETQRGPEGCLSFPGITADVERWQEIEVSFMDLEGNQVELQAKGLLARAYQHELDHLNGVLFIDHISPVKKALLDSKLKRLAKQTKKAL